MTDQRGMRRPEGLRPGDTVALVAPASGGPGAAGDLERARAKLAEVGLRTVVGPHALDGRGYLAGRDEARAADLEAAFADPRIDGVLCVAGGYGALRVVDRLDYELIARRPKVFAGYSDITALHVAIGQRAGLVTFHGPMARDIGSAFRAAPPGERVAAGLGETDGAVAAAAFTWEHFVRAVMRAEPLGELRQPSWAPPLEVVVPGRASGPLVGGNLSLLVATLGTPFEVETAGRILLLEDVDEPPYRIDRMLTQLRLAGKLDAAAGFVVAECAGCLPAQTGRPSLTLREVLDDILAPLGKPAVYGLAAGHGMSRFTLPLGVRATVDAVGARPAVVIEEPGVDG